MGLYNTQGLLNGYKKNNKEREELDYYATPSQEVTNILDILSLNLDCQTVLEPCAGGGHMVQGILEYTNKNNQHPILIATDVKDRNGGFDKVGTEFDFLSDSYFCGSDDVNYIIMNPPYSTIEPFVIRGLEIAQNGLLVLGRLQFLEGKSRYENLLKNNPPTDVYVYVDRIKCFKNGDFTQTEASAQAYAWFYWDKGKLHDNNNVITNLHWIRRK